MSLAAGIAHYYGQGKEERNRDGWLTMCPIHGNTKTPSLSVTDDGDSVKVFCHGAGCDHKEIKDRFRADNLLSEWVPEKIIGRNITAHTTSLTPAPMPTPEPEAPSLVWKYSTSDDLSHAKKYLASRAITIDPLPFCLRWNSYKDKKTGEIKNLVVAAATFLTDNTVFAVQRLFIDLGDYTKINGKMLGRCGGRGVWFDREGNMQEIVVGEGIETTLSAIQATGKNGVAALSTSGMVGLIIPDETEVLWILVDSDTINKNPAKSMPGQSAAYKLAQRFTASREGRKSYLVTPNDTCFSSDPDYLDFNDLLKADPSGESIKERFGKAVSFTALQWSPPAREGGSEEQPAPWFEEALGNGSVSRFLDNNPPALDWIFEGSLLSRTTGMLVGPGAAGKSTLAILMLMAVATGRDILPGIFTPTMPGKALGVFGEDDETILHHRIHTMVAQLFAHDQEAQALLRQNLSIVTTTGQDVRFLDQATKNLGESGFFGEVFSVVKKVDGLRLIVLDPVSRFHGAEENDNGAGTFLVSLVERIAQTTGAAVLFLHHVGKRSGMNQQGFDLDAAMHQDSARGASGLTNGVRWQCNLFGLPEKECKRLIGIKDAKPGKFLAIKVSKKNYGLPEKVNFLERQAGGVMRPFEPVNREIDRDLGETIRQLILDAVLLNEGKQLTRRTLIDGNHQSWKKENPSITRPAVEQTIAACLLHEELFERCGKNASGRKVSYLSRYPESSENAKPRREPNARLDLEIEPEVFEPEDRREPEESESTLLNTLNSYNKVEPEITNRRNTPLRFVSPRNCETVEPEIVPPYGGDITPSGSHRGDISQLPEEDANAEYF